MTLAALRSLRLLLIVMSVCGPVHAMEAPLQLVVASIDNSPSAAIVPCSALYFVIAKQALERAHIAYTCEALPWKRAQLMVQQGERDALVTLATDERAAYSQASHEIVYKVHLVAFINALHPQREQLAKLSTIEQLRHWRVLSYLGDGWAKSHLEDAGITVDWSRDRVTVLDKLIALHGDLWIADYISAVPLIRAMNKQKAIAMLADDFGTYNFRFLIGRHSTYLARLSAIDAALKSMREDGTSARLGKEWFASNPLN